MTLKFGNKKLFISKKIILISYIFVVLFSKLIRYTVMKTTLVDAARGDEILYSILYNDELSFKFSSLDSSLAFNNAAVIFKFINFWGLTTYTQFEIYVTILWNIITFIIILNLDKVKDNFQAIYLILTIAVLNIFNFTIAKEPIQILYFILIYWIIWFNISKNKKIFLIMLAIFFSALTFRSYYVLFAGFVLMISIILNILFQRVKKIKFIHILLVILAIFGAIFVFLMVIKKMSFSHYNELLTIRTHSSNDAATKIKILIKSSTGNPLMYCFEYFILIFRLMFPVELLFMGPKYILFTIYQLIITFYTIKAMKNYKNNSSEQNIALCVYLAFILVSATFEPDFGSWVRHEASAFPVFLAVVGLNKIRRKKTNEKTNKKVQIA